MALAKRHIHLITLSFVLLAVAFLGMAFFHDNGPKFSPVQTLKNFQEADAPPGYPVEVTAEGAGRVPEFDPRFLMLDAIERFSIPEAGRLDMPLGTESGALAEREAAFGSAEGEGVLLGDKLGGIGGGDSDLGDPVRAIGNGLVVWAGEGGAEWGKVLIVAHRLPDGRILQSLYGHLHRIDVPRGGLVARGQPIGLVGTAGGRYPAHLHFELRESDGIELGKLSAPTVQNRLDPLAVLSHHRAGDGADLAPEPLAFRDRPDGREQLILINPDKAPELFGED
jgi:hypothetical protein